MAPEAQREAHQHDEQRACKARRERCAGVPSPRQCAVAKQVAQRATPRQQRQPHQRRRQRRQVGHQRQDADDLARQRVDPQHAHEEGGERKHGRRKRKTGAQVHVRQLLLVAREHVRGRRERGADCEEREQRRRRADAKVRGGAKRRTRHRRHEPRLAVHHRVHHRHRQPQRAIKRQQWRERQPPVQRACARQRVPLFAAAHGQLPLHDPVRALPRVVRLPHLAPAAAAVAAAPWPRRILRIRLRRRRGRVGVCTAAVAAAFATVHGRRGRGVLRRLSRSTAGDCLPVRRFIVCAASAR
mmetsp:Transcript_33512/g.99755  ORF Transcript_33512/g.99755 Transcript_33512/m.99755 type:complete len:299 (+) Transcript_33512:116-1012(+)